ncbi:MAG TPA: hypothetical protein VKA70_03545 [Blastocatellia bacterium]|nr:hypothetical protein [Blastocatellia bacterium]
MRPGLTGAWPDRFFRLFTASKEEGGRASLVFWFSLGLVCALLFSIRGIDGALAERYIIQDDARQHVFWMQRFTDPELFPGDLIANYYEAVAPSGYTAFYRVGAAAGIDPIRLSKLVPILLGLITTAYCFGFTLQLLPVPFAAFLSSLLLNQALWSRDDIVSATARAFLYPLFLAFLYYLARRKLIPCLVAVILQALFYPSIAFVSAGVLGLGLIAWRGKRPIINRDRFALWLCAAGLIAIGVVLAFYAAKSSGFGEVIRASQARQMPEFYAGGRVSFFRDDHLFYWTRGAYSGLLPGHIPELLFAAALFPFLFVFKSRLPLLTKTSKLSLLAQVTISSFVLFFAAHALLFRLYLPSRYTQHTFRIVLCVVAAITLVVALDGMRRIHSRAIIGIPITAALVVVLVITSISLPDIPQRRFRVGKGAAFYDFLAAQPKDVMIATLDDESDNIPSFSARSVLVAREYALPYHLGYYGQMRERAVDLINAQYSRDLSEVKRFIEKHGVDLIVVDKKAFEPAYAKRNRLIQQFVPELAARDDLAASALSRVMKECAVFETESLVVVDAACISRK